MGDTQSAQREDKKDAAAEEEESGKVNDAQTEQDNEDKPLKSNRQISEIIGKADGSIGEVNGHCEDEIAAEAILSPDEDVSVREKPLKEEETPLENVEINENESPTEADANEDATLKTNEMDAKQNDINESFRRFFSNIGLKLAVKKGTNTTDIVTDMPDETNNEEANRPEEVKDTTEETKSENAELNTAVNTAKETCDNDSTTLTEVTSEDILKNAEEKTPKTKKEVEPAAATTPPAGEDVPQEATLEEEPRSTSPCSPKEEVVKPSIKRFFKTGIFSGIRKRKKPAEDETTEKELVDMRKKEVRETTEQTVQDQQQDEEQISPAVEAAAGRTKHKENKPKDEVLSAAPAKTPDEGKSSSTDPSNIIVTEPDILSSQEKEKVQASPLKRLLSGSGLKKLKKPRSKQLSDAKLSDSGEHVSDQLLSSTESQEGPAQPSAEAAGEEDGAWTSFKKLAKKHKKRSSLTNEETHISGPVEQPSDGEQISDRSTEEGKKRKDSSVSWEAVLCGSGKKRGRKTSDSEDETPQNDNKEHKQDSGSKHVAESPLESSNENENEILAYSPKQAGSPSEGDGGSTWKSLKRLVTPKRKAKDEDESKENIQSDSEVTQDEPSLSVKKLLPGRKKRKSTEKQDQVSSDEADKDVASGDEDSETPAVIPLSEFDTVETEVHIQTQADIESHKPEEANNELQQDLLDQMAQPVLPCDSLQTEAKKVKDSDDALEKKSSATPATNEEPDDLTESISNHQQLSDIPEEGIITETMATPASVTEEAARDDTIAEDLIEITSEAITAPEPASDVSLADETEMVSAVSKLSSESSKTSGNTTPVPAECDVLETDTLLHQVVENIFISPKEVLVCLDEPNAVKIVGSVSQQILESFVKEEPTILEIHRRLDATAIKTGLNVEELDAVNEFAATSQTESLSEVNYSVSTEIVSEAPTEEFNTAEIAVDKIQKVNVTHPGESIKQKERIDENHHLVECLPEINAAVSKDTLPEGEEIVLDVGSPVEAHQTVTEPPKMDSQEADSVAIVADDTKDGAKEQQVQTVTEKEDQIMHNITNQIHVEDKDQPPLEVKELQEVAAVQSATLDSEEGSVPSLEEEVTSEDKPAAELKKESVPLTDVKVEPEKEDELEKDAAKTEQVQVPEASEAEHVQVPEVSEAVQASTLDSVESSVQSPEEKVKSEDIPLAETVTDEPKQTEEHLTEPKEETNAEPVDASKTEHVTEQVLQAVQAATLDSKVSSLPSLEKEVTSEDIPAVETATDKPKQETELSVKPEEKQSVETEQEPEVLPSDDVKDDVHVVTESIEEGSAQEPEKQILLEDIPKPGTNNLIASVADKMKREVVAQLDQALETTEDQKTEIILQDVRVEQEDCIHEVVEELQTLTAVHVSSVHVESSNAQAQGKTVFSEETSAPCVDNATVTDEPKHEEQPTAVEVSVEQENESEGTEERTSEVNHAIVAQTVICNLKEVSEPIPKVLLEKTSEITEPLIDTVASELLFKEQVEAAAPLVTEDMVKTAEEGSVVVCMRVPSVKSEDNHRIHVQVVDVDINSAETIVDPMLEVGVTEAKEVIDVCHETVKKVDNHFTTPVTEEELFKEENKVTIQEVVQHVKENLPETVPESVLVNLEQEVLKQPDDVTKVIEVAESESNEVDNQKAMDSSLGSFRERQDGAPAVISDDSATEPQVSEDLMQTTDTPGSLDVSIHKEDLDETKAEWDKSEVGATAEEVKSSSEELGVKKIPEQAQIPIVIPSNTGLLVPQNTGIISSIGNVESPSSLLLEFKLNIQFGQAKAPASATQTDLSEVRVQAAEPVTPTDPTQKADSQKQTDVSKVGAQVVEPATPTDPTQKADGQKQTDVSEVRVQAVEPVEPTYPTPKDDSQKQTDVLKVGAQVVDPVTPINSTQKVESQKQTDVSEVGAQAVEPVIPTEKAESQKQTDVSEAAVQATEVIEPAAKLDSAETTMITIQPKLLDVDIQAMETVEAVEQIKATEIVTTSVQTTETKQLVMLTEKREAFLRQPVVSQACPKEIKAKESVKQTEEENDQDVWMDAEEVIHAQEETEVILLEVLKPLEPQTETEQEDQAGLEHEVEMAQNSKTEEEEGQQEVCKTGRVCEIESEGEDFVVALENPEIATAVAMVELD